MPCGGAGIFNGAARFFLTKCFFFGSPPTQASGLALAVRRSRNILIGGLLYLFNFFDQHFVGQNAVFMLFAIFLYPQIYSCWRVGKFHARARFILLLSSGSGPSDEMLFAVLGENA